MISRRDFSIGAAGAAASALLPFESVFGQPASPIAQKIATSAANQLLATVGEQRLNSAYARNKSQIDANVVKVSRYFESTNRSEYIDHYNDHWYDANSFVQDHVLYCPCCYIILAYLCKNTILNDYFKYHFRRNYKFGWHYEVRWSRNSPTRRYTVDEYSRLRVLRPDYSLSSRYYGWIYYERNGYIALSPDGYETTDVQSFQYDAVPRFVPA